MSIPQPPRPFISSPWQSVPSFIRFAVWVAAILFLVSLALSVISGVLLIGGVAAFM